MKTRKRIYSKALVAALLSLALVAALPLTANATTGPSSGATVNGIYYSGFATCNNSGNNVKGAVTVSASKSVPAGYMGAYLRVFRGGAQISYKGTNYSTVATSSFAVSTYVNGSSGTYYANGSLSAYDSSTGHYKVVTVLNTPNLQRALEPAFSATEYPLNQKGLEYGSALSAESIGHEPDLVYTVATNGKYGYVYRSDMELPEPSSPTEAIDIAQNPYVKKIPVYCVDGATLVGTFEISVGDEVDVLS